MFLEYELLQGGIADPGVSTTVQTTVTVGTVDAALNTTAQSGSDAYVIWSAEVPLAALSPSLTTGDMNVAAEVGGVRLASGTFNVFGFENC